MVTDEEKRELLRSFYDDVLSGPTSQHTGYLAESYQDVAPSEPSIGISWDTPSGLHPLKAAFAGIRIERKQVHVPRSVTRA